MVAEQALLPLRDAYAFGASHGLQSDVDAIRDMEIEWELSYRSSLRRGYIVDLLTAHGLFETFKEAHWPAGNTEWGRKKADFWHRLKPRYQAFLEGQSGDATSDEEDAFEQAFAAEADLRDFLANNLASVEPGLRLYEEDGRRGVEFAVDGGRIDILAVDRQGAYVVFELKLARGRNKALGQILYYMGWVDTHLGKGPCRGVIVAREITEDLLVATKRVKGILLCKYHVTVSLEAITSPAERR